MDKNKINISAEIKKLISKSNAYLNKSENKQQATAYLYIIFSLVALSFFGIFAIGPTITTVSKLQKQYEEDSKALQALKTKIGALQNLSSEYLNLEDDLTVIDEAIPQSPKIAELSRQIETLTINNDLIVQRLDTGLMELYPALETQDKLYELSFSVSVTGKESDVNDFIFELINMQRIISIDRLTTGKQGDNSFSADISGKAFFYKK